MLIYLLASLLTYGSFRCLLSFQLGRVQGDSVVQEEHCAQSPQSHVLCHDPDSHAEWATQMFYSSPTTPPSCTPLKRTPLSARRVHDSDFGITYEYTGSF